MRPRTLKLGPYAVMHAIADHVVDTYLDVTDLIETDIDAHGRGHLLPRAQTNIECIYLLKREVVELRRAVSPLTLTLQRIGTDHDDLIYVEVRRYMRDVLDHTIQAADRIASYDELLSSLVQAALGKVAMQQNVDMRKISAWVAIAAVPTALAGIYGMNFDHMPELHCDVGLSGGAAADGDRVHAAVPDVPAQPLAVALHSAGIAFHAGRSRSLARGMQFRRSAQAGLAARRRRVRGVDPVLDPRLASSRRRP